MEKPLPHTLTSVWSSSFLCPWPGRRHDPQAPDKNRPKEKRQGFVFGVTREKINQSSHTLTSCVSSWPVPPSTLGLMPTSSSPQPKHAQLFTRVSSWSAQAMDCTAWALCQAQPCWAETHWTGSLWVEVLVIEAGRHSLCLF